MKMRWMARAAAGTLALAGAAAAGFAAGAQEKPKTPERTLEVNQVLRVGDRIITAEELIARIYDSEFLLGDEQRMVIPALVYLRDAALLDIEAKRLGLVLSGQEIAECTKQQVELCKAEVKRQYRDVLTWDQWLKQLGMTQEEFDSYMAERAPVILKRRVLCTYFSVATESIELYHILHKTETDADNTCTQLKQAKAGEVASTFERLAVQRSIDTYSNLNKGRIGRIYRHAWNLQPTKAEADIWALKDGEFSKPIQSPYGWHVFLRRRTYTPDAKPLAEMRAELVRAPDVEKKLADLWVLWVGNTQKYPIEQRVPGIDCKPNEKGSK